jgi:hypothetical protein
MVRHGLSRESDLGEWTFTQDLNRFAGCREDVVEVLAELVSPGVKLLIDTRFGEYIQRGERGRAGHRRPSRGGSRPHITGFLHAMFVHPIE